MGSTDRCPKEMWSGLEREEQLIEELYIKLTAQVRIKGQLSEEIRFERAVRQGCGLSPTLLYTWKR